MWEYLDTSDSIDNRNKLGREGWELVNVQHWFDVHGNERQVFYFKRKINKLGKPAL